MVLYFLKMRPNFVPPYGTKSLHHFYSRFHRPLALLIHHLTLLSSAVQVQVRSLYPAWSSWLAWLGFLLYLWKVILFDHQPPEQRGRYDCHTPPGSFGSQCLETLKR